MYRIPEGWDVPLLSFGRDEEDHDDPMFMSRGLNHHRPDYLFAAGLIPVYNLSSIFSALSLEKAIMLAWTAPLPREGMARSRSF